MPKLGQGGPGLNSMSVLMKGATPRIKTRKHQSFSMSGKEPLCQGGNVQFINIATEADA